MTVKTRANFKTDADAALPDNTVRSIRPTHVRTAFDDLADSAAFLDELSAHTSDTANPHVTTKAQVGLGSADNTSDIDKPISTVAQAAIDLKAPLASPALTGTPTAPTPTMGDTTTKIATMAALDAAVSAGLTGYQWKVPVEVVAIANLTLSGEQTIDGVLTSTNRVAATAQTAPAENGIWISAAGAWARATDMDVAAEFPRAAFLVSSGTRAGTQWKCNNTTNPVVGTDPITIIQVGSGLLLDFADDAGAIAGTEVDTVLSPSTGKAQLRSHEFPAARTNLGWTPSGSQTASLTRRWAGQPLDFIADLKAVGDNASPVADTAAWLEYFSIGATRGCGLNIPVGTYHINSTAAITSLRNLDIIGQGGGSASLPGVALLFKGTDLNGFFYMKSCFDIAFRNMAFVIDAPSINYHGIIGASASPAISSIQVLFDRVGFAATTGNYPALACLNIRNAQEIIFNLPKFTQNTIAMILGDLTNVEGGVALGGAGRIRLIEPYLSGDIQLRLVSGVAIHGGALLENHGAPTRGSIIQSISSAQVDGLTLDAVELVGNTSLTGVTGSAVDLQLGTYRGVSVRNCRVSRYKYGLVAGGAGGASVEFSGNILDQASPGVAASPRGLHITSTYGGKSSYERNTVTSGGASNSGVVAQDDRSEAVLLAAIDGVHASLGSNVTMTVGSNTTILTSSSITVDGGLYDVDALISVINAAATTTIIFWLEFGGVELPRTRVIHTLATGSAVQIPFQAKVKCASASGTFRIMGLQSSGTAATIRGASAALGGQTQISARRKNV